ncbi:MAG TPA: MarR family transcriptional regulator [Terriglobales bacterium]|nr:MarR family transcriptional regulator [Terriglobales bacterium]
MKATTTDWSKRLVVAAGEDGLLYSPQMREVLSERVPADALPAVEAFAAIGAAARLLRGRMERWCEKEGLSETRLGILFMLRHTGAGVPLGALAARLRVTPRNITGLIDHLERDGLVARVPDPEDRRSVLAQLTERGTERVDAMAGDTFRQQQGLLAGFSTDELVQLRHLCLQLVSNTEEVDLPE